MGKGMAVKYTQDGFKQAHQLKPGDLIALHYSNPCAKVVGKVTGDDLTVVIIEVPNSELLWYSDGP